jgi:hypothetical protein
MIKLSRTAGIAVCLTIFLFAGIAFAQPADDASATANADTDFPRRLESDAGVVVVHTPQIDTWTDFERVEARAAIEVQPADEEQATFGVIEFTADTDPNLELRVVAFENLTLTSTTFSGQGEDRTRELEQVLQATVIPRTQYLPLDVVLSYVAPNSEMPETEGLSFEPPPIFYSSTPAVLLITDGEPLLAPIDDTRLKYAINTNWDLLQYKERDWYLRNGKQWLKANDINGEWKFDRSLPRDFRKLPDDDNWAEAKLAIPPEKTGADEPTVFASNRPAELIVTDGTPVKRLVGGPGLNYISNTEADLFTYEEHFYYLVSGRWFRARLLRGPWKHVSELPEAFAAISPDHEKGHVLAAIANTEEARIAVIEAQIPRKATVRRDAGSNITVTWAGEPAFELIPGTEVARATNSANDVLRIGSAFYLCESAIWYSAETPEGPWIVADSVPESVYSIPPASPAYHVTHVHVYDSDDESVETGYTSGYLGVTVGFGVAMYGTGYYYPPYYGYPGYGYPIYYPYPYSFGAGSWYNPNTGMYGRSQSVYGPWGGYGRAASYNPETGTYARGRAVWDGDELASQGYAYNPRTGTGVATNRYSKDGKGWGESVVSHNDEWLATQSEWNKNSISTDYQTSRGGSGSLERERQGDTVYGSGEFNRDGQSLSSESVRYDSGAAGLKLEGSGGETAKFGRTAEGDLYAGKDGEVYRRGEDGWQHHDDGNWNPVEVPDDRAAAMDERRAATTERNSRGADRSQASDALQQRRQSGEYSSQAARQRGQTMSNRGFADSANLQNRSSGQYTSRRSELDRSHSARTSGYQRYNNRSSYGTANPGAAQRPRSMRRRR